MNNDSTSENTNLFEKFKQYLNSHEVRFDEGIKDGTQYIRFAVDLSSAESFNLSVPLYFMAIDESDDAIRLFTGIPLDQLNRQQLIMALQENMFFAPTIWNADEEMLFCTFFVYEEDDFPVAVPAIASSVNRVINEWDTPGMLTDAQE